MPECVEGKSRNSVRDLNHSRQKENEKRTENMSHKLKPEVSIVKNKIRDRSRQFSHSKR